MRLVSLLFHDVYLRDPSESGFSSPAADRYKLSLTDFERQLEGLAGLKVPASLVTDLEQRRGDRRLSMAVTVDDGGLSYYTVVADRLEALGWRGHCFVSTKFIGTPGFMNARQLRELDARGHVIGTHSATHPARFSALSSEEMREEWSRSRDVLANLLGHDVHIGSVPGGYFSNVVAGTAADVGITFLMNSEPVTYTRMVNRCTVAGRFTIRGGARPNLARLFALPAPWARYRAWASWNVKGLIKPVLGASYPRVSAWVQTVSSSLSSF
jgi:peptidoglycan/xylan/chitin deacetylase (PgdA/CDA1 family)